MKRPFLRIELTAFGFACGLILLWLAGCDDPSARAYAFQKCMSVERATPELCAQIVAPCAREKPQ